MSNWLIYHEEPITLHSGGRSHWFVDGRAIFKDPNLRESVLACWEEAIRGPSWGQPDPRTAHFIGIPGGGLPWAQAIAERLGATWGPPNLPLPVDYWRLYVVDDVATTGASLFSIPDADHFFVVVARVRPDVFYRTTAWAWIDLVLGGA